MMHRPPYRILIVDDHRSARRQIRRLLGRLGDLDPEISVKVVEADSVAAAKEVIDGLRNDRERLDLIILDYHFEIKETEEQHDEHPNGKHLVRWLRENRFDVEFIMLTGQEVADLEESVLELGAYAYVEKKTLGEATQPQVDGSIGGASVKAFLFQVRNCITRDRLRRRRGRIMEVIGQLHKLLPQSYDFEGRLRKIAELTHEINPWVGKATIRVPIPEGHRRVCLWCPGKEQPDVGDELGPDEGITGHVFHTKEPYWCDSNIKDDPYFIRSWKPTRAELCVPFIGVGGNVIATLNLESRQENCFGREGVREMQLLAEAATPAIEDALILKEVLEMASQINAEACPSRPGDGIDSGREIAELHRTSFTPDEDCTVTWWEDYLSALATIDQDQVRSLFRHVLAGALRLTGGDYGVAYLADHQRQVLRLMAHHGMGSQVVEKLSQIGFGDSAVVAICLKGGQSKRPDGPDDRLWQVYQPFFDDAQAQDFLCVPMALGGKVIGVIDLEAKEPGRFGYLSEKVIEAFAQMAAMALANTLLIASLSEKRQLLVQQELHRQRNNLISLTAHNAKSPLNQVHLAAEMCALLLREERFQELESNLRAMTSVIDAALERLDASLRESERYLTTSPQRLDLGALLTDIVDNEAPRDWPSFHVRLAPELRQCAVYVYGHPGSIREVVRELIYNAHKMKAGEMAIQHEFDKGFVHIYFRDYGPGIAADIKAHLFEPKVTKNSKGSGIGLAHCQALLTLQGARLVLVEENPSSGASFRMSLPRSK